MNLEQLKARIQSGELPNNSGEIIGSGVLKDTAGNSHEYTVHEGWSLISAVECDKAWNQGHMEILSFIEQQKYDEAELQEVLDSLQMEDLHWNWLDKSRAYHSDEYRWFYLYSDAQPQGACLIYHPKDSALAKSKIFYVEYIAVAPWNRACKARDKRLNGVGSILLRAALKFSIDNLGLTPGFSLHSLPQAKEYYKKIKMINIPELDKEALPYFELPHDEATKLLGQ